MSTTEALKDSIIEWAATRSDSAVLKPTEGFYPFDVIADAYKHGMKKGEEELKERMRKKFFAYAGTVAESSKELFNSLTSIEVNPKKMFVNIERQSTAILFTLNEDDYLSDKFMDEAYAFVSDLKAKAFEKDINLNVGFLIDNENINIESIQSDGYGIALNLENGEKIY